MSFRVVSQYLISHQPFNTTIRHTAMHNTALDKFNSVKIEHKSLEKSALNLITYPT